MVNLSQKGYTHEQVLEALLYKDSARTVFYKYNMLDQQDRIIGAFDKVIQGVISQQVFSEFNRQATIHVQDEPGVDYLRTRIQPVFCLRLGADALEYPLGVFVISAPARTSSRGAVTRELSCFDKSILLLRDYFNTAYYIPEGANYVNEVIKILGTTAIRGHRIPARESFTDRALEFDTERSKMSIINELLAAISYEQLHFDAGGFAVSGPSALPADRAPELFYADDTASIIHDSAEEALDLFNIPNVFRAVYTDPATGESMISVWENHNPRSLVSIERVGWRNVQDTYYVDSIDSQDSLDAYVKRNAYLHTDKYSKIKFSTANVPTHDFYDCVFMNHSKLGVIGNYLETAWTMNLTLEGRMTHEARRQIAI